MERLGVLANVLDVEPYLESVLNDVAAASPIAVEARGCGFFRSLELVDAALVDRVRAATRARGVIVATDARANPCLAISPPLISDRSHVDELPRRWRAGWPRSPGDGPFPAGSTASRRTPGRPVEVVQRELGLAAPIVKLASNEGPRGPVPAALDAIVSAARSGNRSAGGSLGAAHDARRAPRHRVEQVVVGDGADAVLNYLALALMGDRERGPQNATSSPGSSSASAEVVEDGVRAVADDDLLEREAVALGERPRNAQQPPSG